MAPPKDACGQHVHVIGVEAIETVDDGIYTATLNNLKAIQMGFWGNIRNVLSNFRSATWMTAVRQEALKDDLRSADWHKSLPQEVHDFIYARAWVRFGEPSFSLPPSVHREIQIATARYVNRFLECWNNGATDVEALARQLMPEEMAIRGIVGN